MRLISFAAATFLLSAPLAFAQTPAAPAASVDADKQALGQEVMNQLQTVLQLRAQIAVLQAQVASLQSAAPVKPAETPAAPKTP